MILQFIILPTRQFIRYRLEQHICMYIMTLSKSISILSLMHIIIDTSIYGKCFFRLGVSYTFYIIIRNKRKLDSVN